MNSKIFDTHIQEIDSFDAYYKNVVILNNNLIIPYINLGLSLHPFNPLNNLLYIDFAYMVFEGLTYVDVFINGKRYKVIDRNSSDTILYFGGNYLDFDEGVFNDMKISCKNSYLLTLDISKLSSEMWIPTTVPNFVQNITSDEVSDFFSLKRLPDKLFELLKDK